MTPEAFRVAGRATVDWIADFLADIGDRPIVPPVAPGDVRASLPASPPLEGEPYTALLEDVDRLMAAPGVLRLLPG